MEGMRASANDDTHCEVASYINYLLLSALLFRSSCDVL